ncbi:PREDICTED: trichohyalin-like isoform X1 [Branchiostoma belcheri]|uniref:Trichohyalin-like isoform X1 n=1 Tax=Branchiostoma belcheri TaxID=7741 RepID=A0A6P4ZYS4_BRABE|nr:PREDICTED: trichohyalin-like isoform X1 [Branchiostoma belcheri]
MAFKGLTGKKRFLAAVLEVAVAQEEANEAQEEPEPEVQPKPRPADKDTPSRLRQSTFPSVLEQYKPKPKPKPQKPPVLFEKLFSKKKLRAKLRLQALKEAAEERRKLEEEKQCLKDARHVHLVDMQYKLRDQLYSEYMGKLERRVKKQREQISTRQQEHDRRLQEQEEKEQEELHRVKKRLARSVLSHDNTYLQKIPKSKFYKMVGLQETLVKQGKIGSHSELEAYWKDILRPERYREVFGSPQDSVTMGDTRSMKSLSSADIYMQTLSHHEADYRTDHLASGLAQIQEQREPSRPSTRGITTIEQFEQARKFPAALRSVSTSLSPHKMAQYSRSSVGREEMELDSMFPKTEFPPLAAYQLDLQFEEPDHEKEDTMEQLDRRKRERKKLQRKILKMYNHSQANAASASRLMDINGQFDNTFEGPSIVDLTRAITFDEEDDMQTESFFLTDVPTQEEDQEEEEEDIAMVMESWPSEKWPDNIDTELMAADLGIKFLSPIKESSEEDLESEMESEESTPLGMDSRQLETGASTAKPPTTPTIPLTMNSLLQGEETIVKEAKCLSTMWVNPLQSS